MARSTDSNKQKKQLDPRLKQFYEEQFTLSKYIENFIIPESASQLISLHQDRLEKHLHRSMQHILAERMAKVTLTNIGPAFRRIDLENSFTSSCNRMTMRQDEEEPLEDISALFTHMMRSLPYYFAPKTSYDYKEVLALLRLLASQQRVRDKSWRPLTLAIAAAAVTYQMDYTGFEDIPEGLEDLITKESIEGLRALLEHFSLVESKLPEENSKGTSGTD